MIMAMFASFVTVGLVVLIEVAVRAHLNGEHHR